MILIENNTADTSTIYLVTNKTRNWTYYTCIKYQNNIRSEESDLKLSPSAFNAMAPELGDLQAMSTTTTHTTYIKKFGLTDWFNVRTNCEELKMFSAKTEANYVGWKKYELVSGDSNSYVRQISALIDQAIKNLPSLLLPHGADCSSKTGARDFYATVCAEEEAADQKMLLRKPVSRLFCHTLHQITKGLRSEPRHKFMFNAYNSQTRNYTNHGRAVPATKNSTNKKSKWSPKLQKIAMDSVVPLLALKMRDLSSRYSVSGKNKVAPHALNVIKRLHAESGIFDQLPLRTLQDWCKKWQTGGGMAAFDVTRGSNQYSGLVSSELQAKIDKYILMVMGAGIEVTVSLLRLFIIGKVCTWEDGKYKHLINPIERFEQIGIAANIEQGEEISAAIVLAAKSTQRTFLDKPKKTNKRYMTFSATWLKTCLKRLRKSWRTVTNDPGKLPPDAEEQLEIAATRMAYLIHKHKIPKELVLNGDETPLMLMPRMGKTWGDVNASNVKGQGKGDKRQCTFTPWVNAAGYLVLTCTTIKGKTSRCQPSQQIQALFKDHLFTQSSNHWVSKETMRLQLTELEKYRVSTVAKMKLADNQKMVVLLDVYCRHRDADFLDWVKTDLPNIIIIFVPANITEIGQPLDIYFNAYFKMRLSRLTSFWLAALVDKHRLDHNAREALKAEADRVEYNPATFVVPKTLGELKGPGFELLNQGMCTIFIFLTIVQLQLPL